MNDVEQELRALLRDDSADVPYRGVNIGDVADKARGIRRARLRTASAGLLAGLGVVLAAAAGLRLTGAPPEVTTTAATTSPTQSIAPSRWLIGTSQTFTEGGRKQSFTVSSSTGQLVVMLDCGPGTHAYVWIDGGLALSTSCDAWQTSWHAIPVTGRGGVSVVEAAVVPSGAAGGEAGKVLASVTPYPAAWTIRVMEQRPHPCTTPSEPRFVCLPPS
ncbi:hypothetical protein [Nonomuraea soli]|uniref:Uncharacterized protein n=1 Tax=Nonomuraea soli TaxID=1032476 RepID=A0A7W0HTB7_9ACTN|nr:hypothetical protein [Nonomuraea soli]MBA2894551.1 hypothetical protein [Nonomuraea soli]